MANRLSVFCRSKKYYPFIMKVNSGADSQITIPTFGSGYNYDFRVQGGQAWYGLTGNHMINFPSANTDYFIEISGEFPHIYINNNSEKDKFLDVVQCGDIEWKSMERAFYGASNLTWSATDIPNIQPNCYFYLAFRGTKVNPATIKQWAWVNFSGITSFMLDNTEFNQDISNVDLTNINSANSFIRGCSSFNNSGQRLVLDWLNKSINFGTYPFDGVKVKEYEFLNSENLTWSISLQSGVADKAIVEVIIFHNRQTDIDFKTGVNNYPNLIPSGVKETIDAVDKTAGKILSLNPTVYANFETYIQGLGYIDIQDYLTQTSNNWTVIN